MGSVLVRGGAEIVAVDDACCCGGAVERMAVDVCVGGVGVGGKESSKAKGGGVVGVCEL